MIVVQWHAVETDPSRNLLDFLLKAIKLWTPLLNIQIMTQYNPWPLSKNKLSTISMVFEKYDSLNFYFTLQKIIKKNRLITLNFYL